MPFELTVEDLWDIWVGPVTESSINTTVAATPIPPSSLIPPPPIYYSPWPPGAQQPLEMKNESWSFPKGFMWGVAGAAFQIEGAVKDEGRGPCIWDVLGHRVTGFTTNNYTADVTNNNYYLYKQDIARIAAMGVKAYSFSLSWSRIMPFGRGPVNTQAIDHYNDVINTCLEYNIVPVVTLYHWDLPLYLQNTYGGWLSEEIVPDFVAYAKLAFAAFGDRVKDWYTVNEPVVFCDTYPLPANYFKNYTIPNKQQPWICGHSVLLAHSQAYHLGKSMIPNSTISYKNNGGYRIPLTNSSADAEAVKRAWDFGEGWFSDPIYLTGDYSPNVKAYVSTFLRDFTEQEKAAIKGSADTYAIDGYTSQFHMAPDSGIEACVSNASHPFHPTCANTSYTYSAEDGGWAIGAYADLGATWLHKGTEWVPIYLKYLADRWAGPRPLVVSEFGFAEPYEELKTVLADILYDSIRASYFRDYMRGILIALSEGVNVAGCLAWSFYDNFEWSSGFATKFGMQYVNFSDPQLPRYYKASFFEYKHAFDVYQEK
ncbi:glycoside hydrolase [Teratosphaeria nubilosa]|uniref:Glycoside hydrolase n=1 Tax=Teratosphaeria nubilosa TaxID=161662 RepID=A0A6G1KYK4_9PEZI|nr:glycoside hydrolase [Teratosphaeria nubilosa]